MKKKYLHIGVYSVINLKYYKFIEEYFDLEEHTFAFYKNDNPHKVNFDDLEVISIDNTWDLIKLIPKIFKSDKIYFHGFFIGKLIILFYLFPNITKKCSWIIWGSDLRSYNDARFSLRSKIHELMRRRVFKNMGAVITHISEDYEKAKEWYGIKAEYKDFFSHPYQAIDFDSSIKTKNEDKIKILIGNSADEIHRHKEMMYNLKKHDINDIRVICPLSYAGNKEYVDSVIQYGNDVLKNRIEFITNFLEFDEYKKMLKTTDIGIYAIRQQGALGNIILMLSMGKKVYLVPGTPNSNYFIKKGFKIFDYNELNNEGIELKPLSEEEAFHNINLCKKLFSINSILDDWKSEFNSLNCSK